MFNNPTFFPNQPQPTPSQSNNIFGPPSQTPNIFNPSGGQQMNPQFPMQNQSFNPNAAGLQPQNPMMGQNYMNAGGANLMNPATGMMNSGTQMNPMNPMNPTMNPMNTMNQQPQMNQMNPGMNMYQQPQYPLSHNLSILNQPQMLNLTPSSQQNFAWKINQKSDPFSINIGNTLRDKEVQTLAPQLRARVAQYESQLEDNKKYLKMSAEHRRNIQELNSKFKKDMYQVANNSILLRNELKKEKFIFDELKNEISVNATIVNDFLQYNDLYKKGRLQIIQVPSQFLMIAVEKMLNSLNVLKKKIDEISDLAKIQLIKKETSELEDDYEFFINLVAELYQYFIYVAHLVLKFDENYMEFRTNALEYYKSMGYTDLEKTLEHESKKLYKDDMIENLMKIVNKLEENKKIEKAEEKV